MYQNSQQFFNNKLDLDSQVVKQLQALKIGYYPHSKTLKQPGDRRRFVFFAQTLNLNFEIANPNVKYDVVFLTSSCNISQWLNYKKQYPNTKIIFELIDSYVLEKPSALRYLKGTSRFITGKDSKFYLDYNKAFYSIIKIADSVVCSTPLQKKFIEHYNKNVHVSLDYFENEIPFRKSNFKVGEKLKIVWEGQSYTVENLLVINEALKQLKSEVELHIITDKIIKYPFKIFDIKTDKLLSKLSVNYHFHEWQYDTFCTLCASCDLAIIPLNEKKEIMWNKPENKLLFFWQLGVPTLTSSSPAYKRVMDCAGLDMNAQNITEWINKIRQFKNLNTEQKNANIEKMNSYVLNFHSKQNIIDNWIKIFEL